jgi:hypothetical protein
MSLSATAACSIFGDFGSFSTEDPAAATDSGVDANADPNANGDGGATGSDGGSSGDASGEAGLPFCVPGAHAFCSDFEGPDAFSTFDGPNGTIDGIVELSTTRAKDGVQSLRTALPRRETGKSAAVLSKVIIGPWRRSVMELDMYLEPIMWKPGDVNAALLMMAFLSDTQSVAFFVVIGSNYVSLAGGTASDTVGPPIATGKWLHVKGELTTSQFQLTIDGATRSHPTNLTASSANQRLELALGIDGFNTPAPAFSFHYDNFTVDFP